MTRTLPPVPPVRESYGDNLWPAEVYMRLWAPPEPRRLSAFQRWLRRRRISRLTFQIP